MTKLKKILLNSTLVVSAFGALAVMISCGNTGTKPVDTKTPVSKESPRVALTDPENPRWVNAQQEFVNNFDSMQQGASTFLAKTQDEQNNWINSAITSGTKGLILGTVDGQKVSAQLAQAKARNIPVVAYDRLISGTNDYDWYTTYDNEQVGKLQGLSLAAGLLGKTDGAFKTVDEMKTYAAAEETKLKSNKIFFTLGGAQTDNNAKLFFGGAMAVLNELVEATKNDTFKVTHEGQKTEAEVLQEKWDYTVAQNRLSSFLTSLSPERKTEFAGVLAPNDGMARAAVNAVKANGLDAKTVFITGQDLNKYMVPLLKAGETNMTISKPDKELSFVAITILNQLMEEAKAAAGTTPKTPEEMLALVQAKFKEKNFTIELKLDKTSYLKTTGNPVNTILLTPAVVTKENVDEFFAT